jgi:AmmeMemoRadiSam system protein A
MMIMDIGSIDSGKLKALARRSLDSAFSGKEMDVTESEKETFGQTAGAFVTLNVKGDLRGCIGRLDHEAPLWRKISELARAAAFEDNRFPPIKAEEMDELDIEITILGEPVEINSLEEVVIGRDGLIVEKGFNRGLLLPQVATEYNWDLETFLSHTCLKAGLGPDEWKTGGVKISRFEGIVI